MGGAITVVLVSVVVTILSAKEQTRNCEQDSQDY